MSHPNLEVTEIGTKATLSEDNGEFRALVGGAEAHAFARRLALCWNSHDALVLFCREFLESTPHRRNTEHLEELARAAVQSADDSA